MQQRHFGNTQLSVSEVGFGCARIGGVFEGASKADILTLLRSAFDEGITFFDTADMYTQGESEKLLGLAFRGSRDKIVIASKAGYCLPRQKKAMGMIKPLVRPLIRRTGIKRESIPAGLKGTITQNFSPSYLVAALEGSLKRLHTDYLDLFQLHSPPVEVLEQGEFLVTLEKLRVQGKIRHYGVSCETTQDAIICLRYPGITALQVRLSLLEQSTLAEVLPRAAERGVAVIAREVFAGGMLAKPLHTLSSVDRFPDRTEQQGVDRYQELAERWQRPLPELALQFVSSLESVSVTLIGMRTMQHLADGLSLLATPRLTTRELGTLGKYAVA